MTVDWIAFISNLRKPAATESCRLGWSDLRLISDMETDRVAAQFVLHELN